MRRAAATFPLGFLVSFFYSSQTWRTRLDLTRFYEEEGSAENRLGILAREDIVMTKSAAGKYGGGRRRVVIK